MTVWAWSSIYGNTNLHYVIMRNRTLWEMWQLMCTSKRCLVDLRMLNYLHNGMHRVASPDVSMLDGDKPAPFVFLCLSTDRTFLAVLVNKNCFVLWWHRTITSLCVVGRPFLWKTVASHLAIEDLRVAEDPRQRWQLTMTHKDLLVWFLTLATALNYHRLLTGLSGSLPPLNTVQHKIVMVGRRKYCGLVKMTGGFERCDSFHTRKFVKLTNRWNR